MALVALSDRVSGHVEPGESVPLLEVGLDSDAAGNLTDALARVAGKAHDLLRSQARSERILHTV